MAESNIDLEQQIDESGNQPDPDEYPPVENEDLCFNEDKGTHNILSFGIALDKILQISPKPLNLNNMRNIHKRNCTSMISPFNYDPEDPEKKPVPIDNKKSHNDRWDSEHVRMPCSPSNLTRDKRSAWVLNRQLLISLKTLCDNQMATVDNLKQTISDCVRRRYNFDTLEKLINDDYSNEERARFMYTTLPKMCDLALSIDTVFTQPPPLLFVGSNRSVTMSQHQAAVLLACAFFCLFPYRLDRKQKYEYKNFPHPNFNNLYQNYEQKKVEKLKCILHYFERVTDKMPNGVITIQRVTLPNNLLPSWEKSKTNLCDVHLTTGTKIEDIPNVLHVDFACKYIGGGVLGNGCVQEEIRFSICPEMLVSLLICERMEENECIFLIGCERYSSYKGYSKSFKFDGNYNDTTPKDSCGRKLSHLVAMDAIFFRDRLTQYETRNIERELIKAYTSFRPLDDAEDYKFGIATGNWGCGAFNGDKHLKAIIQLMAASEAQRPLIYASYHDTDFITVFNVVYDFLKAQGTTVADLYSYIQRYLSKKDELTIFEYILSRPINKNRF